jgi:hypothetical protein
MNITHTHVARLTLSVISSGLMDIPICQKRKTYGTAGLDRFARLKNSSV